MKKILGVDLGTNSIGWAVVTADDEYMPNGIEAAGSRIIPMDAATLGDFDKGNSKSQTAERTRFRGVRRLRERNLLRRERLHRILSLIGFLPQHYAEQLNRYGKFLPEREPKLAWCEGGEFLFQDSFSEMVVDFKEHQPQLFYMKTNGEQTKIPYDWTIYFLRKKALTQKITGEELAWILLHFNQKRGYYQLRGEDDENEKTSQQIEFHALKVVAVEDSGDRKGKEVWYNVHLENGWIYRRACAVVPDWIGKVKEFIVTTDLMEDGTQKLDKDGNVKRSFRSPKEDDWTLVKKRCENDIALSKKTVGTYIYDTLLQKPDQKIRGGLIRTIERKFYKDELRQILESQTKFHAQLQDSELYTACVEELYPNNKAHRTSISNKSMAELLLNDIIFYQRPLKSKKSLISNCPYEVRRDKEGKVYPIKCIAKSHPLFQEFRLWQFVSNIRIFQREGQKDGRFVTDMDVTSDFLGSEDKMVALFEWLNDRKNIKQDTLLNSYFKIKKVNGQYPYRWNYVEDKEYPCNETRNTILVNLDKANTASHFLTREIEEALWHILYSVEDKHEIVQAMTSFAAKHSLGEEFVEQFSKIKSFKKDYGSYSAKTIKKLLPLMRMGREWSRDAIDAKTMERIEKIIAGECDETIGIRVREKAIALTNVDNFRSLPLWLACYVVYDRHSEAQEVHKWNSPEDIDSYLRSFKQHSLRNPIVEQVITETLRTVRDIWKQAGQIDEIHVELGREMKNPADKRAAITKSNSDNENANLRVKALLTEFMNPEFEIENVRSHSPSQQEILRIYEDEVLSAASDIDLQMTLPAYNGDSSDINVTQLLKKFTENDYKKRPTKSEVLRYKLWLEQKYCSPYTGETIPLSRLFTHAYEIEHIIPQSRYFDDSFTNKVICEAEINRKKDNLLGYEFIKKHSGEKVELGYGKWVEIFTTEDYEKFVKNHYSRSRAKMKKLLMDDIPDGFIERQLNDSRYISKVVKGLLSNIVREDGEQEAISKNVITCTGGVTDRLKRDWGMGNVWNQIILPRFQRLNEIQDTTCYTATSTEGHTITAMPLELQKGFNKKRIDHRHHAMDAIVIACATRSHVHLLSNESAKSRNYAQRHALSRKLRRYERVWIEKNGERREIDSAKEFFKPWDSFCSDARIALEGIIVSFKQNLRVINKTTNHYQRYEDGDKVSVRQTHGDSWAIRKPMHKDTVSAEVNLRQIKTVSLAEALRNPIAIVERDFKKLILKLLSEGYDEKRIKKHIADNSDVWSEINLRKIKVYYFSKEGSSERYFATRKELDTSFDKKKIEGSITDTAIQKILLLHLQNNDNNPELAFSPDGIDEMNSTISTLNEGKAHQPIRKVRVYEKAEKFAIGQSGNKRVKFVEAAKGTNLFFAVYESEVVNKTTGDLHKKRIFKTIPLNVVIERQKQGLCTAPEEFEGAPLLFVISPNDLVYVPQNDNKLDTIDNNRIYKFVSCTSNEAHFIPACIANPIINTEELGSNNKAQKAWSGEMIKEICIPIKVDRLGRIIKL